jgi:molybdopterin synthase sulfur carrier subunit
LIIQTKMKILFFGVLSELTGSASIDFKYTGSVSSLKNQLSDLYPELANHSYQVAVNQNIASEDTMLSGNEDVALLPPFAGG